MNREETRKKNISDPHNRPESFLQPSSNARRRDGDGALQNKSTYTCMYKDGREKL